MVYKDSSSSYTISKIAVFLLGFATIGIRADLKTLAEWRYIEYDFDSIEQETLAIQSGSYDYSNNLPVDVDSSQDGRIFLTLERNDGVPASLTTMERSKGYGGGPLLKAYPNWSFADVNNCSNIIGPYRIAIDECNRLWALDSGKMNNRLICQPKLLTFDLGTDELLQIVEIPNDVIYGDNGETHLLNIILDTVGANCSETDVYIADSMGNGLVIWNGKSFWRIQAPEFEPDPEASTFTVNGDESFYLSRGVFAMAVSHEPNPLNRQFYFRPLSSYSMYEMMASDLHRYRNNQTMITYNEEPAKLRSQSVAHALSDGGILFFSSVGDSSILCWNRRNDFVPENIAVVAINPKTLQFATGVKILRNNGSDERLLVLTNRYQRYQNRDMDFTDVNFRLFVGNVSDLVSGTVCE